MERDNGLFLDLKNTPSRYVTWVDYSIRMKQSEVSREDHELFFRKYYGFVIGYCRKVHKLEDHIIADIIDLVFDKFIKSKRLLYDSKQGAFRPWFRQIINNTIKDYFRSKASRDKYFKDEDGHPIRIDLENIKEDMEKKVSTDDDKDEKILWNGYLSFLAWESVAKKANQHQVQCFLWRFHNKKKPAEIAKFLRITPEQVSEHIRAFKDKIVKAMQQLDESCNPEELDWDTIKQQADLAKEKYLQIAETFPVKNEA